MNWTDELKERAKELWQSGLSARAVAGELGHGLTRNAVIGVLARMGASHRDTGFQRSPNGTRRPTTPRIRKPKPVFKFASAFGPYLFEEATPYTPKASEIVCLGIPFHELEPNQCRFIPGEPVFDAPSCGHPVKPGSSYCPGHSALCFQPISARSRYSNRHINYVAESTADAGRPVEVAAA